MIGDEIDYLRNNQACKTCHSVCQKDQGAMEPDRLLNAVSVCRRLLTVSGFQTGLLHELLTWCKGVCALGRLEFRQAVRAGPGRGKKSNRDGKSHMWKER